MLTQEYNFEKTELFSTPVWTSDFKEIDNNKIEKSVYNLRDLNKENLKWTNVWESEYCPPDSYDQIFLAFYPSIFSLTTNPRIRRIDDCTPKFHIYKKGSSSKLINWIDRPNDLLLMYFVKVPSENIPFLLLKDPRPLVHGNYFYKTVIQKEEYIKFEPSVGTCVVLPTYMEYFIDTNHSEEDLIVFTAPLTLSW